MCQANYFTGDNSRHHRNILMTLRISAPNYILNVRAFQHDTKKKHHEKKEIKDFLIRRDTEIKNKGKSNDNA